MMKKFFLFLLGMAWLETNTYGGFSIQEVEDNFFKNGLYRVAAKTIREQESLKNNARGQVLLFAMGDFNPYYNGEDGEEGFVQATSTTIQTLCTQKDHLGTIIKALWHINDSLVEDQGPFPTSYAALFTETKNPAKGISLLSRLALTDDVQAAYMLSKIYLRPAVQDINQRGKGFSYLKQAAQLNHLDAQSYLNASGIDWKDQDQFGDHCKSWWLVPNCGEIPCEASCSSCNKYVRACLGYGPSERDHGWVDCNCFLCGFSTELNTAGIASYATRGFLNMLRALEHPIKLCTAGTTIAATILQALHSPAALPVGVVATGCATLSAFIKQETNPANTQTPANPPQPIDQQPFLQD
jgi:hypothetical protein